jgi:hypothetical protein
LGGSKLFRLALYRPYSPSEVDVQGHDQTGEQTCDQIASDVLARKPQQDLKQRSHYEAHGKCNNGSEK